MRRLPGVSIGRNRAGGIIVASTSSKDGFGALCDRLNKAIERINNQVKRRAITKATRVVRRQAEADAARETGVLKKSIDFVVRTYLHKGSPVEKVVVGIVGPKTGSGQHVSVPNRTKSGKRRSKAGAERTKFRNPSKYAHLVEDGTRHSKPRPFVRTALEKKRSEVIEIIARELKEEITKW